MRRSLDGFSNKCKKCKKGQNNTYRSNPQNKSKHKKVMHAYHLKNPGVHPSSKNWQKKYPEKYKAAKIRSQQQRRAARRGLLPFPINLKKIYKKYNGCCRIFLLPVTWKEVSWDHIKPVTKGGLHIEENLQPSHMQCNRIKGNRSMAWAHRRFKQLSKMEISV